MRNNKKIVVIALLFCLTISILSSCQTKKNVGDTENLPKKQTKLVNPEVSMYVWTEESKENQLPIAQVFEEKYGGKINFTIAPWKDRDNVIVTRMTSGDAFDLFQIGPPEMPKYTIKDLIQPLDKYIDWNDPVWKDFMHIIEQCKYKGNHYGVSTGTGLFTIFYNKTMFENNGIPTPLEYYKQGKWNWDTFQEVAIKLTQDTDKDGAVDQWGYANGYKNYFVLSNNTDFVKFNNDGSIILNLNDPKVIEAIQFYQDAAYKYKFTAPKPQENLFPIGKLAMCILGASAKVNDNKALRDAKFDIGIAPFPKGPSTDKEVYPGRITFWAIGNGAKNPEGAAAFLHTLVEYQTSEEVKRANLEEQKKFHTDEEIQLIEKMDKSVITPQYLGLGDMNGKVDAIYKDIQKGTPVVTVIEQHKSALQAEIDGVLKDSN